MESLYDRISAGTMSIDEITESMQYATSEGGQFFQSMEKQSQTLSGQLATLQDNANELLGSITSGLSEEISGNLLPMVNDMIAQLQSAFDSGGLNAMIDEATNMIPDLLELMSGKLDDVLTGLSKWAPKAVDAIMSELPAAIRGASDMIPKLTSACFEVASTILSNLIAQLPELVPALLDGIGNMVLSLGDGLVSIIGGIYDGVEQAFHQGQTKLMNGIWVDDVNLNFGEMIEIEGTEESTTEIQTAYSTVREALMTDLLTPAQRAVLINMLGSDWQAIYSKLKEFGLTDEEATEIANQITSGGDTIVEGFESLNLGVDGETLAKWALQSGNSKVMMMWYAQQAGLNHADIVTLTNYFDQMNGEIASATPNIVQTIYDALTDGAADTPEVVDDLENQTNSWADSLITQINTEWQTALGNLDTTAPDYQDQVDAINKQYGDMLTSVETTRQACLTTISTYAGASSEVVQGAHEEIAALESDVNELNKWMDDLNEKATSQSEQAYNAVRAGLKVNDEQVEMAFNLKFSEFKLDEQEAEDLYNQTVNDLLEKWNNGEITDAEYNQGVADAEAEMNASIEAAKQLYQQQISELLSGLAESEGYDLSESGTKVAAMNVVSQLANEIMNSDEGWEGVADETKAKLASALSTVLDEEITVTDLNSQGVAKFVASAMDSGFDEVDTAVLSGRVGSIMQQLYEDGALEGTDFNVEDASERVISVYASMFDDSDTTLTTTAAATVQTAAEEGATQGITAASAAISENKSGFSAAAVDLFSDTDGTVSAAASEASADVGDAAGTAYAAKMESTIFASEEQIKAAEKSLAVNTTADAQAAWSAHAQSAADPMGSQMASTINSQTSVVSKAAESMATKATNKAKSKIKFGAKDAGKQMPIGAAGGVNGSWSTLKTAVDNLAQKTIDELKKRWGINSPSRVGHELGDYFGQGVTLGLNDSMSKAIEVASALSGDIVNASGIQSTVSVSMAGLEQSIVAANEKSQTAVNLDGKQIATIQGRNNTVELAWRRTRQAKGYGYRKK